MRIVSKADAIKNFFSLLRDVDDHSVVIEDGDEEIGAIVSMEDYELVQKSKVERFLKASEVLGEQIREGAAAEGLSLKFSDSCPTSYSQ
jgi:hypothetical protein